MSKITLADLTSEPTIVEMFDHSYRVLALTRSVQKKLEKAQPALAKIDEEEDADKVVDVVAEALGGLLEPENGAPAAKKTLIDAWKADKLNVGQLGALFARVQEASLERPT